MIKTHQLYKQGEHSHMCFSCRECQWVLAQQEQKHITSVGSTTACLCAVLVWSAEGLTIYPHQHVELFVLCSRYAPWEMPVTILIKTKRPQSSIQIAVNMSRVHKMNWMYWIACSLKKKSYFTIEEPPLLENTCYSHKICVVHYVKQNITINVYCNYK